MTPRGPWVVILTDEVGWHTRRLQAALRSRGAQGRCVDLARCDFDSRSPQGLRLPGYGAALPDAAIVRGIAGGSFEAVTKRLGILHALRELGVPVYNDARAIERSVDKGMTSFLLRRAGLPTPPAWCVESPERARAVLQAEWAAGHSVVLKPLFGSQGKGLQLLPPGADLPDLTRAYGALAYLQRHVPPPAGQPGHDWRVLVIGGRARAAMQRQGNGWIHNVAQGARCTAAELTPDLARIAEAASAALGLDYAGVDLIPGALGPQILEVNGVAAWRGLQAVTDFDIAGALVEDLLQRRMRCPVR